MKSYKPSEYKPNWAGVENKVGWAIDTDEERLDRIKRTPPVPFVCNSYRSQKEIDTFGPQGLYFRPNTKDDGPAHESYEYFEDVFGRKLELEIFDGGPSVEKD